MWPGFYDCRHLLGLLWGGRGRRDGADFVLAGRKL